MDTIFFLNESVTWEICKVNCIVTGESGFTQNTLSLRCYMVRHNII